MKKIRVSLSEYDVIRHKIKEKGMFGNKIPFTAEFAQGGVWVTTDAVFLEELGF